MQAGTVTETNKKIEGTYIMRIECMGHGRYALDYICVGTAVNAITVYRFSFKFIANIILEFPTKDSSLICTV